MKGTLNVSEFSRGIGVKRHVMRIEFLFDVLRRDEAELELRRFRWFSMCEREWAHGAMSDVISPSREFLRNISERIKVAFQILIWAANEKLLRSLFEAAKAHVEDRALSILSEGFGVVGLTNEGPIKIAKDQFNLFPLRKCTTYARIGIIGIVVAFARYWWNIPRIAHVRS